MHGMSSWLNILSLGLIINKTLFLKEPNRCMTQHLGSNHLEAKNKAIAL